jgi:hypothetical protein
MTEDGRCILQDHRQSVHYPKRFIHPLQGPPKLDVHPPPGIKHRLNVPPPLGTKLLLQLLVRLGITSQEQPCLLGSRFDGIQHVTRQAVG